MKLLTHVLVGLHFCVQTYRYTCIHHVHVCICMYIHADDAPRQRSLTLGAASVTACHRCRTHGIGLHFHLLQLVTRNGHKGRHVHLFCKSHEPSVAFTRSFFSSLICKFVRDTNRSSMKRLIYRLYVTAFVQM